MRDDDVRAALQRHWAASDANDFTAEHQIYDDAAVLEYPQSRERIRGRLGIQASRMAQPSRKRFTAALDIDRRFDGVDLCRVGPLWLARDDHDAPEIGTSARIGLSRET